MSETMKTKRNNQVEDNQVEDNQADTLYQQQKSCWIQVENTFPKAPYFLLSAWYFRICRRTFLCDHYHYF